MTIMFLKLQLRRECSLSELMDHETCMVKQIRSLDSDMQTLVYENYNKFISATGKVDDTNVSVAPELLHVLSRYIHKRPCVH